jgi:hypothetical protein
MAVGLSIRESHLTPVLAPGGLLKLATFLGVMGLFYLFASAVWGFMFEPLSDIIKSALTSLF